MISREQTGSTRVKYQSSQNIQIIVSEAILKIGSITWVGSGWTELNCWGVSLLSREQTDSTRVRLENNCLAKGGQQ